MDTSDDYYENEDFLDNEYYDDSKYNNDNDITNNIGNCIDNSTNNNITNDIIGTNDIIPISDTNDKRRRLQKKPTTTTTTIISFKTEKFQNGRRLRKKRKNNDSLPKTFDDIVQAYKINLRPDSNGFIPYWSKIEDGPIEKLLQTKKAQLFLEYYNVIP